MPPFFRNPFFLTVAAIVILTGSAALIIFLSGPSATVCVPHGLERIRFGEAISPAMISSVCIDAEGSVITGGRHNGTLAMGATSVVSTGIDNGIILKHTEDGALRWIQQINGTGLSDITDLTTDAEGNVYAAGTYWQELSIGELTISALPERHSLRGGRDIFIIKFSSSGEPIWFQHIWSRSNTNSSRVGISCRGDKVFVSGEYFNDITISRTHIPLIDTPIDAVETNESESNTFSGTGTQSNMFVVSYNLDGEVQWWEHSRLSAADASRIKAYDVAASPDGGCAVTGYYAIGPRTTNIPFEEFSLPGIPLKKENMFLIKFDAHGIFQWENHSMSTTDINITQALGVDCDDAGNFYVAGAISSGDADFNGTILHAEGRNQGFISKYSPEGTMLWAKAMGGPAEDAFVGIATSGNGDCVVIGGFFERATYGCYRLTSSGSQDAVVVRINNDGEVRWAQSVNCRQSDFGKAIALRDKVQAIEFAFVGYYAGNATVGSKTFSEHTFSQDNYVVCLDD